MSCKNENRLGGYLICRLEILPPFFILPILDFSEASLNALQHAVRIAASVGNQVVLFHVSKQKDQDENLQVKLEEASKKYSNDYGLPISYVLKSGSIFDQISDYASEGKNKVNFVILGTHGIKGSQKLFGSKALRVISGSKVPFLVVQKNPSEKQLGFFLCRGPDGDFSWRSFFS